MKNLERTGGQIVLCDRHPLKRGRTNPLGVLAVEVLVENSSADPLFVHLAARIVGIRAFTDCNQTFQRYINSIHFILQTRAIQYDDQHSHCLTGLSRNVGRPV